MGKIFAFYKYVLIFLLILFESCVEKKKNDIIVNEESKIVEIKDNNITQNIILDKDLFNHYKNLNIKENNIFIGTFNFAYLKYDKYFFISPENCSILISNINGEYNYGFNIKGKGLGKIQYVNASVMNDSSIILYDSSLRKFVEYSFDGKFIKEIVNGSSSLPYHISAIAKSNSSDYYYYCVGIDNDGYKNLMNKKEYANFFVIDLKNQNIINRFTMLPSVFNEYLKADDISASPISNPFNLNIYRNDCYVYDWVSGEILHFSLNNPKEIIRYKINNNLFKRHIPLSVKKNTPELSNEWFKSGAFLNNIFEDNQFMIFYITMYNNRTDKIDKKILFVDKINFQLKYILTTEEDYYLKFVNNENLIFIGYENNESYELGKLTVYKINYKKLF